MKKRIVALLAACTIISFSAGLAVSGSSLLETISVYLNKEVKMTLRGSPWEAKIDGQTMYPITHEGSTYLPVRAVAEALDVPIRWDQETRSVHIAEPVEVEIDAAYAGSVEAVTVTAGEAGEDREYGDGSVRFVSESDGRSTLVIYGTVREEGDASMSITGSHSANGWSSSDPVEIKIDTDGNIIGEGIVGEGLPSEYRIKFNGKILPETLQLQVAMERIKSGGSDFVFNYELERIASTPPAEENGEDVVIEEPVDDSGARGECSRTVWQPQHIANLSGGPMQMVYVPRCLN